MKVGQLISILKQFDPNKRVVMEFGVQILEPEAVPFKDDGYFRNYTTRADFGDIVIRRAEK